VFGNTPLAPPPEGFWNRVDVAIPNLNSATNPELCHQTLKAFGTVRTLPFFHLDQRERPDATILVVVWPPRQHRRRTHHPLPHQHQALARAMVVTGHPPPLRHKMLRQSLAGTMRVFRKAFTLEDVIGSHTCSLEASMRVTNGIPLGCTLALIVTTVNSIQTLKVPVRQRVG
jgi:hypothetical protein